MANDDRDGRGAVEWIDFGPEIEPDTVQPGGGRWRWWYGAGAALLVLALIVVRVNQNSGGSKAKAKPSPTPSTSSSSTSPVFPLPSTSAALSSVEVIKVGHPILDVPADWELFGQGGGSLVRVQLRDGIINRTSAMILDNGGALSFVVGPDRAIIRPYDSVPGYEIPDGQPARRMTLTSAGSGPVLPGPDRDHYWATTGANGALTLTGFDGKATSTVLTPPDGSGPSSDGAGYLMFSSTGGTYDLRPSGVQRITTGVVLATNATKLLLSECDDKYRCSGVVVDRASGARRTIAAPSPQIFAGGGTISPDGTSAAVMESTNGSSITVHLIDLATGKDRPLNVTIDVSFGFGDGMFVWSPDSKWLFAAGGGQKLVAVDAKSGKITDLGIDARVTQVALRTATS